MNFFYELIFLLPIVIAQNPICPMCSLGAPHFGQSSLPNVDSSPSFSSYPRNPLSMYQGDAAMFGSELGKAIAQRIQQLYASGAASPNGNAYSSFPDVPQRPTASFNLDSIPLAPPVTEARALEYPAPTQNRGCPYCFGNNGGYGSNIGFGGYAASPARGRRIEFVKEKKKQV